MSALVPHGEDLLAEFGARFEKLNRALDEALTGWDFTPARRTQKQAGPRSADSEEAIRRSANLILTALRSALLNDPDGLGALDYYQLKTRCKLNDAPFGLALNELIPSHLRTRHDGEKRYYFLRRALRQTILTRTRLLKRVA